MSEYVTVRFTRRQAKALQKLGALVLSDEEFAERVYAEHGQVSVAMGATVAITDALVKPPKARKK